MANDTAGDDGTDKVAHRDTYAAFMTMLKWGIAVVSVVLILMAIFLA